MPRLPVLLLLAGVATPLAAQKPDSALPPRAPVPSDSVLHQGATVLVRIPAFGGELTSGTIGRSNTSPGCLGIALEKRDPAGRQYFAYLKAVTFLQVDRRTNRGFHARLDSPPSPDDLQTLTKAQIAIADSGCHRK
jgi:hypothetical protein